MPKRTGLDIAELDPRMTVVGLDRHKVWVRMDGLMFLLLVRTVLDASVLINKVDVLFEPPHGFTPDPPKKQGIFSETISFVLEVGHVHARGAAQAYNERTPLSEIRAYDVPRREARGELQTERLQTERRAAERSCARALREKAHCDAC